MTPQQHNAAYVHLLSDGFKINAVCWFIFFIMGIKNAWNIQIN